MAVGDEHDVLQPAAGLDDALQRGARAAGHRAAQHEHRLKKIYKNQENILIFYLFVMWWCRLEHGELLDGSGLAQYTNTAVPVQAEITRKFFLYVPYSN